MSERFGTDILLLPDPEADLPVSPTGDLVLVSGASNVQNALRRRTLTTPGELLFRAQFGAGIEAELSKPATPPRRALIANQVRRNLLDDPRVSDATVTVAAGTPADSGRSQAVTIGISARLKDDAVLSTTFIAESL